MLAHIKNSPAMMSLALTVSKEALYTVVLVGGWLQADGIDGNGPSSNGRNINNVTLVQELQFNDIHLSGHCCKDLDMHAHAGTMSHGFVTGVPLGTALPGSLPCTRAPRSLSCDFP